METTIVYWGYTGRMEKKMETTIKGLGRVYAGFDVGGQGSQESGHGAPQAKLSLFGTTILQSAIVSFWCLSRIGGIPPGCKDC